MAGINEPAPRVALVARVSTRKQDSAPQVAALRDYAARRGWTVVGEYVDVATGRHMKRPEFQRLLADAKARKVDIILTTKLDRIARSIRDLLKTSDDLKVWGVDIVCMSQDVDTTTASGKFMFGVLGLVAEFEADLNRERTMLGLEAARAAGKRLGRPLSLAAL